MVQLKICSNANNNGNTMPMKKSLAFGLNCDVALMCSTNVWNSNYEIHEVHNDSTPDSSVSTTLPKTVSNKFNTHLRKQLTFKTIGAGVGVHLLSISKMKKWKVPQMMTTMRTDCWVKWATNEGLRDNTILFFSMY